MFKLNKNIKGTVLFSVQDLSTLKSLPPLVKILLVVFIRWNKSRSYTEKLKYTLFNFHEILLKSSVACMLAGETTRSHFTFGNDNKNKNSFDAHKMIV